MGTWGITLQSTPEKAREKDTLGKVQTCRHERYRTVLIGRPRYSEAWYNGVPLFGVPGGKGSRARYRPRRRRQKDPSTFIRDPCEYRAVSSSTQSGKSLFLKP
eukprot:2005776-Rhodomonas_salina.3